MYSVCTGCTLLKVVGYYDLSVLSMSVMVSKKSLDGGGWAGGLRHIQYIFCLTLQSPLGDPSICE